MTVVDVDGRHLRREQNRETVLDALTALFAEGVFQPSANDIAARAGLSPRSLFRYFDDVEDLSRAAIERQLVATSAFLDHGAAAAEPTASKVRKLAAARVRLYDACGPAARAARVCAHRNPLVATQLQGMRARLREQVRELFAPELSTAGADALLPALDLLLSFEAYELLRGSQRMSKRSAERAMVDGVDAVLESVAAA